MRRTKKLHNIDGTRKRFETPALEWQDTRYPNILQKLYVFEQDGDESIPYDEREYHHSWVKNPDAQAIVELMKTIDTFVHNIMQDLLGDMTFLDKVSDIKMAARGQEEQDHDITEILILLGIKEFIDVMMTKEKERRLEGLEPLIKELEGYQMRDVIEHTKKQIAEELQELDELLKQWYLQPIQVCKHTSCLFCNIKIPQGMFWLDLSRPTGSHKYCRTCASRTGRNQRLKHIIIEEVLYSELAGEEREVKIIESRKALNKSIMKKQAEERSYIRRINRSLDEGTPLTRKYCPKCKEFKPVPLEEGMLDFMKHSLSKVEHPYLLLGGTTAVSKYYLNQLALHEALVQQGRAGENFHRDKNRMDSWAIHCKDCVRGRSRQYYNEFRKKDEEPIVNNLPMEVLKDDKSDQTPNY